MGGTEGQEDSHVNKEDPPLGATRERQKGQVGQVYGQQGKSGHGKGWYVLLFFLKTVSDTKNLPGSW